MKTIFPEVVTCLMGYRPGDKVKWRQSYSEKGCSQAWPEICYCPGVKEDQMIFCLREIVSNTDSAGGYSFTEFYVLPLRPCI